MTDTLATLALLSAAIGTLYEADRFTTLDGVGLSLDLSDPATCAAIGEAFDLSDAPAEVASNPAARGMARWADALSHYRTPSLAAKALADAISMAGYSAYPKGTIVTVDLAGGWLS